MSDETLAGHYNAIARALEDARNYANNTPGLEREAGLFDGLERLFREKIGDELGRQSPS